MDKTYLISNDQHVGALPDDGIYESTWILFAEPPVIESGFDSAAPLIEVYKYISSNSGTQTKSKVVAVDEARAEWKFWIGQGFQRITDKENKGWKYTGDMRAGLANYRFAKEMQKKLTAKVGEINERETA
tara:strand:- start:167 stop:556 length:390 start_codon:yes stop_codon:yes gene_type:complete